VILLIGGVCIVHDRNYHNKLYINAKDATKVSKKTFVLYVDRQRAVQRDLNPGHTVYSVQTEMGEILDQEFSFGEPAKQFSEIYSRAST
jgi:hypothetical protein